MNRSGGRRSAGQGDLQPEQSQASRQGGAVLGAGVRPLPAGGIFKSAAVEVLRRERRLMPTGEICRLALEWGLLNCSGKTPEATMASALYGDIKRKDRRSVFIRPQEGLFGLREWVDQGFLPPLLSNPALLSGNKRGARAAGRSSKSSKARRGRGGDGDDEDGWSEEEEGSGNEAAATGSAIASIPYGFGSFGSFGLPAGGMAGLQALGDIATSPLRKLLSQDSLALAAGCIIPEVTLSPPQLVPTNEAQPASGPRASSQPGEGGGDGARRRLQLDLPNCSTDDERLTSPPLYMALQSPQAPSQPGSTGAQGRGRQGSLFSPQFFPAFSPGPHAPLPSFDATPAALRGLLPGEKQPDAVPASQPASHAAAAPAVAAPLVIKGDQQQQPAASWVMVPQGSSGGGQQEHNALIHASQVPSTTAGALLQQHTPVGESTGFSRAAAGDMVHLATPLFNDADPYLDALAQMASHPRGLGASSSSCSVLSKILELEGKVAGVQAHWGVSHPQTGRAYLLLYHACRHKQVATICRDKGEAALAKACSILRASSSQGSEAFASDFSTLVAGLHGQCALQRTAAAVAAPASPARI